MFQFLKHKNKSSFKQAHNQITMIYFSLHCGPSADVLIITENLMACSKTTKNAQSGFISHSHLYVQSRKHLFLPSGAILPLSSGSVYHLFGMWQKFSK